jgi:hypothetical protein
MTESPKIVRDSETVPTRDLLRHQRKAAYEAAKAKRKSDKRAEKEKKRADRQEAQAQRDAELWQAMRKGTELENE